MSLLNTPNDPRHAVANPMGSGFFRVVPLAAVILGFVLVSTYYARLPDQIPTHFNGAGEVDGYGPRLMLWILPAINLGVFLLLEWSAKLNFELINCPVAITEENAAEQHRLMLEMMAYLRLVICLAISWIIYTILNVAQSGEGSLGSWFLPILLVPVFGLIGYYLLRAKAVK